MQFDSISDFESASTIPSGNIQIDDGLPIHLHWTGVQAAVTVVAFSGAVSNKYLSVPAFNGHSITRDLPANVLLVSDPTLILDRALGLGWYLGSRDQPDLPDKINRIIRAAAGRSRVVLFGSSGGGFAALDQGRRLPGSTVLACNPQTDVSRYVPAAVNKYLDVAFGSSVETLRDSTSANGHPEMSVVDAFGHPLDCHVVYVQGSQDAFHLENHRGPFLEGLHPDNSVIVRSADFGPGHAPASRDAFRRLLVAAVTAPDAEALRTQVQTMTLDTAALPDAPSVRSAEPTTAAAARPRSRGTRWSYGGEPMRYDSLADFMTRRSTPHGSISVSHGLPVHLHWEDNGADTTIVTFQGNVNDTFAHVPVYMASTTTEGLNANRLLLSDPSLKIGRDVTLAWYAGSDQQRGLQMALTHIITSLAGSSRVVLFGAGGGGFAALEQSTRIPGSTVLAMNPHTDILGYRETVLRKYLSRCWGIRDEVPGPATAPMNHSVVDAFARPVPTQVVYVQNRDDEFHVENHMKPFLGALHPDNRVLRVLTDLPGRHVIPGKASMRQIFEAAVGTADWSELSAAIQDLELSA